MKTLFLKGDVGYEITADKIRQQIDINSTEKLQVIVNSPGGFVFEAFEIYDLFESYKGQIEFVLMPYAASAMSYIVMAGKRSTRTAFKNSIWMGHRVQSIALGTADDMQREADLMRSLENVLIEAYQKVFKNTKEEILEMLKNEIWAVGWEQLTDMGLIDNVIDSVGELEIEESQKAEIEKAISEANSDNAKNFLSMRMKKTESRMRIENENLKNIYEKAVAKLSISQPEIPAENNIIEEVNMDLQKFLESNPTAKAEYEKALQSAEEKGIEQVNAEIDVERKRINSILECSGVVIPDNAKNAVEKGMSDGEFAKEEIKRQNELRKNGNASAVNFGNVAAGQTPGEQDTSQDKTINKDEFDKESLSLAKNFFGGKK